MQYVDPTASGSIKSSEEHSCLPRILHALGARHLPGHAQSTILSEMCLQPVMEDNDLTGPTSMFHNRAQYMFVLAPSRTVVAYLKARDDMVGGPTY